MARLRQLPRLVLALVISYALITVTDEAPWYFGGLESAILTNQDLFIGLSLAAVSLVWLWRSGYLRRVQSRGRLAVFEFAMAGALLLALTAFFGLGLSPLDMCLGGGGGFTCYASTEGFLRGILGLMVVVVGEELFFVVYVTTELNSLLGKGGVAVAVSALIYSTSHIPILQAEGFGSVYSLWFLEILVGTSSLIACYWLTGRNLAVVVLLHAYWDGIGALVLFPNAGVYGPILLILGQLSLPAAITVVTHRVGIRRISPSEVPGVSTPPEVPSVTGPVVILPFIPQAPKPGLMDAGTG